MMKICFVQPGNLYQVNQHQIAFSLTFPQIICNLGLSENDYCIYVEGRIETSFEDYLSIHDVTHVFISCITSNFPRACFLAETAHALGCVTVLGGIFPTLTSHIIQKHYKCFDYIISGGINKITLSQISNGSNDHCPQIIEAVRDDNFTQPLSPIMLNPVFTSVYDKSLSVCYELGSGCKYSCSFCTLRKAFGCSFKPRDKKIIQNDLEQLSTHWSKLKLIDDDIYQSYENFKAMDFSEFKEVIVETRIDHLSDSFFKSLKSKGITHIITGIESFSLSSLNDLQKSAGLDWNNLINRAVDLCDKYSIMLRPVLMINPPQSTYDDLVGIIKFTEKWTPENHVDLLLSFYTPHPGMPYPTGRIITNDLSLYDHLHLVYLPTSLRDIDPSAVVEIYDIIANQTKSRQFNPRIEISYSIIDEYSPFFCNQDD